MSAERSAWPLLIARRLSITPLAAMLLSCGEAVSPSTAPKVARIELALADSTLGIGDSVIVHAAARDSTGALVTSLTTAWSTSDTSVMSVSSSGTLRGKTSGIAAVRATIGSITASRTICVRGGAPQLEITYGDDQHLVVGTAVSELPVFRVADAGGNAIPCVVVRIKAGPVGATVAPDSAITDAGGIVRIQRWSLSQVAGVQTLQASVGEASVTAHADGVPGPPAQLKMVSGNDQIAMLGRSIPVPLTVQLVDQYDNALPNLPVAFRPAVLPMVIDSPDATTDSGGVARTAVRVNAYGRASVTASAAGLAPVTFSLTSTGLRAKTVVTGSSRACAFGLDDVWYCWGNSILTPTVLPGSAGITGLSAGFANICGIAPDATIRCWGNNEFGELGIGTTTPYPGELGPVQPLGVTNARAVFAGNGFTCALTVPGDTWCWGYNQNGEIGIGSQTISPVLQPTRQQGGPTFSTMATQSETPCAVDLDGAAYCWGFNVNGNVGDGTQITRLQPTAVATATHFRTITNGSCALTSDGQAFCWGLNGNGEVGDGTTTNRYAPVPVATSLRWLQLASGASDTCGIATDHTVLCWGVNHHHSLGSVASGSVSLPTVVAPGVTANLVAVGFYYGCVISDISEVLCWGNNTSGTLGDGTRVDRAQPVPVIPPALP